MHGYLTSNYFYRYCEFYANRKNGGGYDPSILLILYSLRLLLVPTL